MTNQELDAATTLSERREKVKKDRSSIVYGLTTARECSILDHDIRDCERRLADLAPALLGRVRELEEERRWRRVEEELPPKNFEVLVCVYVRWEEFGQESVFRSTGYLDESNEWIYKPVPAMGVRRQRVTHFHYQPEIPPLPQPLT